LLFELDARPYQVEFERAAAEVQRAESSLKRAGASLSRVQKSTAIGAVSVEDAAAAKGAVDDAQAGLLVAKAGLERAKLDLDATRITSPIDGYAGVSVLGVGNLAAPTTTLVTVVATDPLYVTFWLDEYSASRVRKLVHGKGVTASIGLGGGFTAPADAKIDTSFPYSGKVDYVDNHVQIGRGPSGVRARAVLANPGAEILLGARVRLRLMIGEPREELSLPARAVRRTNQNQLFDLVIGPGDVIE